MYIYIFVCGVRNFSSLIVGAISFYALFLIFSFFLSGDVLAGTLDVYYFNRPPYLVARPQEHNVEGLVGARLSAVLQRAGVAFGWHPLPPPRQLLRIRSNEGPACGAGWFRTAEREAFARFSLPIYRDRPAGLLVRRSDLPQFANRRIESIVSNRNWRMGVKLGFSYGSYVDRLLARYNPPVLTTSSDNAAMARMLAAGRFDYMIIAPEEAGLLIRKLGKQQIAFIPIAGMPPGNTRHLMCSKKVPASLMARIDRAILALYGDLRAVEAKGRFAKPVP